MVIAGAWQSAAAASVWEALAGSPEDRRRRLGAGAGPLGSRLIRMAPWFDDGSLTVTVQARYYWQDAAEAHRVVEQGHTRGKLALIVDDDLAAAMEI